MDPVTIALLVGTVAVTATTTGIQIDATNKANDKQAKTAAQEARNDAEGAVITAYASAPGKFRI